MKIIISAAKIRVAGKISLSGAFLARSSARCMRRMRMASACTRSALATLVPKRSVCTSSATSELTSSTPVRVGEPAQGVGRLLPARVSAVTRPNSAESTGLARRTPRTRAQARVDRVAGLDADDHQVERVGQRPLDLALAAPLARVQPDARQDEAEAGARCTGPSPAGDAAASR